MASPIVYFPLLPDPVEIGSEKADDVRQWIENFLIPACLATDEEDKANVYLVVGGDGKFMKSVREKHGSEKIFFGINRGTMGFLLNPIREINEIPISLDQIQIITAKLMKVIFIKKDGSSFEFLSFNDAFCGGNVADHISFSISGSLNHFPKRQVSGNGIIISTPQGTTGYALKARGTSSVLPLDTNNWFISGIATGPYPCDQVSPQEICVTVNSRQPVNGYADGYSQEVKDIERMIVKPTAEEIKIGFLSQIDFAARRMNLAQKVERGDY
ncbi:MAG: hypothetical protein Q7K65_04470 [Candidatus Buchananbacteria bacterium]|nr:hypothetical protein [Candidatus Buchananbacteria bacterium]